jgi:hypothetical protein
LKLESDESEMNSEDKAALVAEKIKQEEQEQQ